MTVPALPPIGELVPHGPPMCLLDRVLAYATDTLDAEVAIAPASMFCTGGQVGAWVGIEYMAQAVAAFAGMQARARGEAVRVGLLLGTRRYTCSVAASPVGTVLRVRAHRVLQGENGLGAFECRIEDAAAGTLLAEASITVFQPENVEEFMQRSQT